MDNREIIRLFGKMWNEEDYDTARQIIAENMTFRSSLGEQNTGIDPFCEYVRGVHKALGNFHCEVEDVVSEGAKVVAKILFSGEHRDVFFGVPATGRKVEWYGAGFFDVEDGKIQRLWFMGDVDGIKRQLLPGAEARAGWKQAAD